MGRRALRRAAGGGALTPAQGARPVRQYPPGHLLPRARGRLEPQARGGGRARHHHPAGADRRRLFRRAQDHYRSRQRPEARDRHPGLRHLRDRAHQPRRLRARAQAPQQGHLDGEAQRDEDRRALERGGQSTARARVQGRHARAPARRRRRHAARALAQAVRCDRHRQPVRRHALRRRRHAYRLARHAAVGLARRGRSQDEKAQGDVRAGARLGARHRRQGHRQPDRHARLLRHGSALLLRHGQGGGSDRPGDRRRARQGAAHGRHQVRRRADREHGADGRRDRERDRKARGMTAVATVRAVGLAALALLVASTSGLAADAYPSRPVRLIVPFAAGGLNDVVARLVAPHLERALGQPFIVDNRPAASGIVGTDATAKAQPDGYTLLMVASSFTVIPATKSNVPYERDLAPIVMVAKNSLLFLVNPKVPANSLAEFVALAKANPGKLNYASPGAATQTHLVVELFSRKADIKLQHIPYRGGAPAMTAMVAGDTQFTAISTLLSLPQIQAGALRAIANGSLSRDAQLPDLPTVAEQGFPGFEAIQWIGLLTTGGTPKDVIERINAELNRALRDPDLIAKFAQQGLSPAGGTSADFQRTIATDLKNWTETAHATNITAQQLQQRSAPATPRAVASM